MGGDVSLAGVLQGPRWLVLGDRAESAAMARGRRT
jgi:hypothetical protein